MAKPIKSPNLFQSFIFALALIAGSMLGLFTCCARVPPPYVPASSAQLSSVVTLVDQRATWVDPHLSDENWTDSGYRVAWQGYCNAFAVGPDLHLVTAAHCVTRENAGIGSELRYLPVDGLGIDRAKVLTLDIGRDYATLEIYREGGLVALPQGPVPQPGAPVVSVSAYFGAQSLGAFDGSYDEGYYRTTQWVDHGWSGGPVITNGRVWGLVSKFTTWRGERTQGAIVSAL